MTPRTFRKNLGFFYTNVQPSSLAVSLIVLPQWLCSHSITAMSQFYHKHQQSLTLGSLSSSSSSGLKASAQTGFRQKKREAHLWTCCLHNSTTASEYIWSRKVKIIRTICLSEQISNKHLSAPCSPVCSQNIEQVCLIPLFFSVSWDSFSFCLSFVSLFPLLCVLCWDERPICSPLPHAPGVATIITSKEHYRSIHWIDIPPMAWIWAPNQTCIKLSHGGMCLTAEISRLRVMDPVYTDHPFSLTIQNITSKCLKTGRYLNSWDSDTDCSSIQATF